MIKDSKIKDILIELSQMKTKFLYGEKSIINENEPVTNKPEIVVKPKKNTPVGGNPSLVKLISCKDGLEYVNPNISIGDIKITQSATEWFNVEKLKKEKNMFSWITACQLQGQIKTIQKRNKEKPKDNELIDPKFRPKTLAYTDPKKFEENLLSEQNEDIENCLNMCYQSYNNLPEGCAFAYENTEYSVGDETTLKVRYAWENWFLIDYKKWTEKNNQGDSSYVTREPYSLLQMTGNYYKKVGDKYYNVEVKDTLGNVSLDYQQNVFGGQINQSINLPLTNSEKERMESNNPFTYEGKLKLGEGKYICARPQSGMVNLRTSPEVNEDKGWYDPTDNWVAWTSDAIVGKYIKTSVSSAPSIDSSKNNTDPFKKYVKKIESYPNKFKKVYDDVKKYNSELKIPYDKIVKDSKIENEVMVARETYQTYACNGRGVSSDGTYNYTSCDAFLIAARKVYNNLSNESKNFISNMVIGWYQVELNNEVEDKSDPGNYVKKVWVSQTTTDFCKTEKDETSGKEVIQNTNYGIESFKGSPLKGLKNPGQRINVSGPSVSDMKKYD